MCSCPDINSRCALTYHTAQLTIFSSSMKFKGFFFIFHTSFPSEWRVGWFSVFLFFIHSFFCLSSRGALFFSNEIQQYALPFMGSDPSVVKRTQRFLVEEHQASPVSVGLTPHEKRHSSDPLDCILVLTRAMWKWLWVDKINNSTPPYEERFKWLIN